MINLLEKHILLDETTSFNFECKFCGNCCKQMLIRLTPFDIINLAQSLKLPTYDFISEYVVFLKAPNIKWFLAALKHVKKGNCMFKKGKKCSVHFSRPLPCRLFPVGRKDNTYILHKTEYCKGHISNSKFILEEWLNDSEALPYLEMSQKFYNFMEYDFSKLSAKNKKIFYKLIYDYDSASLESTVCLDKSKDKVELCFQMATWFLNKYEDIEVSDEEFLSAYEKQVLKAAANFK